MFDVDFDTQLLFLFQPTYQHLSISTTINKDVRDGEHYDIGWSGCIHYS